MKKKPNQTDILLIRSPFTLCGDNFRQWVHRLRALPSVNRRYHICDAAVDYVKRVLLDGRNLSALIKAAPPLTDQQMPQVERQRTAQQIIGEVVAYDSDQDRIERILGFQLAASPSVVGDTVGLLDDFNLLDAVLNLVSTAYSPCLVHRHGVAHTGLNKGDDLIQFSKTSMGNPFFHYALNLWQPFKSGSRPDAALLYVDSPGQMGPAATLMSAWQNRWPQIPLRLVGTADTIPGVEFLNADPSRQGSQREEEVAADAGSPSSRQSSGAMDITAPCKGDEPQPLVAEQMHSIVSTALDKSCHFIVWESSDSQMDAVTQQLYAASRQGIWNHLILNRDSSPELEKFAAANANIVHSYCHRQDRLSIFSDAVLKFPSVPQGYGNTQAMPGRPLWMDLKDGALIQSMSGHYGIKPLMRLRVREDGRSLFEVGENLSYQYQHPDGLPDGHLDEIVRMVDAGGSVNTQFVRHNLERAYLIAYVEEEGVIVGNSSLKHPRKEYIEAVSRQSGIDLHRFLERGYTSVRPEYRGLGVGAKLLEGLTKRAGEYKIFSVIAEGNIATQKMALRNRTRRVATFFSQKMKKDVSVWIPEWMLPEGIVLPPQPDPDADNSPGKDPV